MSLIDKALASVATQMPLPTGWRVERMTALDLGDGGNAVAGYLILMPVVDEMHLLNVTVAPVWQRQGLGRWLLRAAVALTLAHGFGSLLLEVRPSNAGAIALYRRVGFAEIGRRKRYYPAENSTREDALVMRIACEASGVEAA
jgi:ribosomal-protein-alanine N-acetyltransferase